MNKQLVSLIAVLLLSLGTFGQTYSELVQQGNSYYKNKDFKKSLDIYQLAFKVSTNDSADLYKGAASAAMAGEPDIAFEWLELAVKKGWLDVGQLKNDAAFVTLRSQKRWGNLIGPLQTVADKQNAEPDMIIQQQLEQILRDDQNIRTLLTDAKKKFGNKSHTVDSLEKIMAHSDSINQQKVGKVLDTKGWLGKDRVGSQGNQALYSVVQHADLAMQKLYFPMIREAVDKGDASIADLALLEDRIALREGRKQVYGSQISTNQKTGKFYVSPLEDPDNVDSRRSKMGLPPMTKYLKNWDLVWDVAAYKKQLPELEKWEKGRY